MPKHSRGIFDEMWVERLYRGIKRNTTRDFRFVCFTDKEYTFQEPIEQVRFKLPYRNMLSLLEPFSEDFGRVVFMGLDTIITGNIDELMDYDGPFAMLKDPLIPDTSCSGVMSFPYTPEVWRAVMNAYGAGDLESHRLMGWMSDMMFLNTVSHVHLDDYVSGIYSYKAHIRGDKKLLRDAKIVYFHGKEKPHELSESWVDQHWGGPINGFHGRLNTPIETMFNQAAKNMNRNLPMFKERMKQDSRAIIVGGGPSLEHTHDKITALGGTVYALNGAHDYLISKGAPVHYQVMLDARKENVSFVKNPKPYVTYLLAAQCHPDVFDALENNTVQMWLSCFDDAARDMEFARLFPKQRLMMVGGGATVGLKAINLAYLSGYRDFHFFGFDSCYQDSDNHAYPQPLNANEDRITVTAAGRQFICAPWMAKQAAEFQKQMRQLVAEGCSFTVHGDGLISWICQQWQLSTT